MYKHCPGTTFCCGTQGKKVLRGGAGERQSCRERTFTSHPLSLYKHKQRCVQGALTCLFSAAQIYSSAGRVFHKILNSEHWIVQLYFAYFLIISSEESVFSSTEQPKKSLNLWGSWQLSLQHFMCLPLLYLWSSIQVDRSVFISFPGDLPDVITLNEISHSTLALGSCSPSSSTSQRKELWKRVSLAWGVLKTITTTYGIWICEYARARLA